MRMWKVAAATAGVGGAGLTGALLWFSRRWIVAPRVEFEAPGDDHLEEAQFRTDDGIDIHGWFLPGEPGRPALIPATATSAA
jgi:hypothetical protein